MNEASFAERQRQQQSLAMKQQGQYDSSDNEPNAATFIERQKQLAMKKNKMEGYDPVEKEESRQSREAKMKPKLKAPKDEFEEDQWSKAIRSNNEAKQRPSDGKLQVNNGFE